MINLELYRIFYVVAKEKNITKASKILNISQPAVTKHIKNLEYELGEELFIRTKKGVILNEYGRKIFLNVKNALNSIDIVFYKDVPVRQAYKEFLNETSKLPGSGRDIDEKHLKLLEEIAKSIGYKNINWESIKHYYCPNGLMDNINKENELRELSIRSTRLYIERECMENDKGQP